MNSSGEGSYTNGSKRLGSLAFIASHMGPPAVYTSYHTQTVSTKSYTPLSPGVHLSIRHKTTIAYDIP